ncbi:hypothetical protein [Altericroceibacterium endophyticum]|nr:hypothetical protein [Altericroceibacterium endophyticum]
MKARHYHERLIIKAMRLLAAPAPGPSSGEGLLRCAGIEEEGVSALAAVVALLPRLLPAARLHGIGSPFVSSGEIVLLGELGRRQRQRSASLLGAKRWPLKLPPSLGLLLDTSASALSAADIFLFHRTISAALDYAREMPSPGISPMTGAAPGLRPAIHPEIDRT